MTHPLITYPIITHPLMTYPFITHPIKTHPTITPPLIHSCTIRLFFSFPLRITTHPSLVGTITDTRSRSCLSYGSKLPRGRHPHNHYRRSHTARHPIASRRTHQRFDGIETYKNAPYHRQEHLIITPPIITHTFYHHTLLLPTPYYNTSYHTLTHTAIPLILLLFLGTTVL